MKWKRFGKIIFTGVLVVALAMVVLLAFADVEPTNWLGDFIWWLIGLVILMVIGFIILYVAVLLKYYVWDRLTKTKEEREDEESRNKFLDNLRKRGLLR